MNNFIFSGYGHAAGRHEITNADIMAAIRKEFLKGFREDKIIRSDNYQAFLKKHPNVSPFDYFAGYKMGFFKRRHVRPFPPVRKKLFYAETSLELGVKSIHNAISDAGLQIGDISAWFVSTVSPHEQAPGIAATIKAFFTDFDNNTPTISLASGCSGFNLNLQHAVEYLEAHPQAKHVVVAHTETMSDFLTERVKFVPLVTFGDAAAAVVLTRTESHTREGLLHISNFQDMHMVDFVGVDKASNLYMEDSVIKDRAIVNMSKAGSDMLQTTGWKTTSVDLFVPHQTGNAILIPTAKNIGFTDKQLYTDAQKLYGNVSGATIPIGLSLLHDENKLKPGMKILSAVAGVGGKYGAFSYLVPETHQTKASVLHTKDLAGKTCLITGSTGAMGSEIALEMGKRGANLFLHYAHNEKAAAKLAEDVRKQGGKATYIRADFTNKEDLNTLVDTIFTKTDTLHYLVHASGISEDLNKQDIPNEADIMQINCFAPLEISKKLLPLLKETVLYIGTAAEDIPIAGFPGFTASKSCLHGSAGSAAGEYISQGIRTIYYMAALLDKGTSENIPPKEAFNFMLKNGQETPVLVNETAYRIVSSLYIPKVLGVQNSYEGPMVVRRDGYVLETDV